MMNEVHEMCPGLVGYIKAEESMFGVSLQMRPFCPCLFVLSAGLFFPYAHSSALIRTGMGYADGLP